MMGDGVRDMEEGPYGGMEQARSLEGVGGSSQGSQLHPTAPSRAY